MPLRARCQQRKPKIQVLKLFVCLFVFLSDRLFDDIRPHVPCDIGSPQNSDIGSPQNTTLIKKRKKKCFYVVERSQAITARNKNPKNTCLRFLFSFDWDTRYGVNTMKSGEKAASFLHNDHRNSNDCFAQCTYISPHPAGTSGTRSVIATQTQ